MVLTMVYNTQDYWVFGLFPSSGILENTTFRKLDPFPSSGPVIEISSFYGAQLSRCLLPHLHLRTETDPVSEKSCSLEYQTMEKVQKPSNPMWKYTLFVIHAIEVVERICLEWYSNGHWNNVLRSVLMFLFDWNKAVWCIIMNACTV
jgi:hypothetical protein